MLVLLLERGPNPPKPAPKLPRPLTLPKPCWLGRKALGMKMNDRSVDGKMYRMGMSGKDMRTGLSRRSGGRWWGRRVCLFKGTDENIFGSTILPKKTRTCIFPTWVDPENDRLGGCVFVGDFWAPSRFCTLESCDCAGAICFGGLATVSCRSCAHGESTGPEGCA